MFDEVMLWIFGVVFFVTAISLSAVCIFAIRRWIRYFFPTWEKMKMLYPVPEGVTASFWNWQKALVRYKPCGALWPFRIQATDEGLLIRKGLPILSGHCKDSMICLKWDHLVYLYAVPFPWATRFLRPHIEFQVYETEISIIAPRRFWENIFPKSFLDVPSKEE